MGISIHILFQNSFCFFVFQWWSETSEGPRLLMGSCDHKKRWIVSARLAGLEKEETAMKYQEDGCAMNHVVIHDRTTKYLEFRQTQE